MFGCRLVVAGALLAALVGAVASDVVSAAPTSGTLTINATPNPIITGDAVLIHGQLNTTHPGGKKIVLRPADRSGGHVHDRTDHGHQHGRLLRVRRDRGRRDHQPELVCELSRGGQPAQPHRARGRRTRTHPGLERCRRRDEPSVDVHRPGHSRRRPCWRVGRPAEADGRQRQQLEDDRQGRDRRRLELIHQSRISSTRRVRSPPPVRGRQAKRDWRRRTSLTVVIEQTENPTFTIATTAPIIVIGQSTTISGRLFAPGSTSTPSAGDQRDVVGPRGRRELRADHLGDDRPRRQLQLPRDAVPQRDLPGTHPPSRPPHGGGPRNSSKASPTSPRSAPTRPARPSGRRSPSRARSHRTRPGITIDLEQLGADGHYQIVKTGLDQPSSAYQFTWTFGAAGTKTFRVVVPGDTANVKGVSPAVAITVALPPVESLPTP